MGAAVIPVATHRVRVERNVAASSSDPWESAAGQVEVVAEHVRAVLAAGGGAYGGRESDVASTVVYTMLADPCELTHLDVVVDEATGERYPVVWVVHSPGLAGLASTRAGLSATEGGTA